MANINDHNYKIELKHEELDDCSVYFSYDDINIIKNEDSDLFELVSLINMIEYILGDTIRINNYLKSYRFYKQLEIIDENLIRYGFVYLRIVDKNNKICKVGRTFDINQRYNTEEQEEIIILQPVDNDRLTETKILREFTKKYKVINKTKETFEYDTIQNIKKLFMETCKPNIIKPSYKQSSHIRTIKTQKGHPKLYISLQVCDLVFHNYVSNPVYINKFNTMKGYIINSLNKDVYISNEFNTELNTRCMFWKFHKYTIIQNESDLYINGSRLWNSIIRNDNSERKTKFSVFLKSKPIQEIKNQFNVLYPDKQLYTENINNTAQPYFSGKYVHHILIHFIISYLNARYAIMVSELMYRLYYNNYLKNKQEHEALTGGHRLLTLNEYNKRYIDNFKKINNISILLNVLLLNE